MFETVRNYWTSCRLRLFKLRIPEEKWNVPREFCLEKQISKLDFVSKLENVTDLYMGWIITLYGLWLSKSDFPLASFVTCLVFLCPRLNAENFLLCQGGHGTGKTGKTGNLEVHFSRQGKHREFAKNIKNVFLHREFNSNTGKIWRWEKKNNELVILSGLNYPLAVLYHFNLVSF